MEGDISFMLTPSNYTIKQPTIDREILVTKNVLVAYNAGNISGPKFFNAE